MRRNSVWASSVVKFMSSARQAPLDPSSMAVLSSLSASIREITSEVESLLSVKGTKTVLVMYLQQANVVYVGLSQQTHTFWAGKRMLPNTSYLVLL